MAKEKKPSFSKQIVMPTKKRRFDFKAAVSLRFTRTNDDLQGHGGPLEVSLCPFLFLIPLICQKSPSAQWEQSGGQYEIWQYINEFIISCACVALCRAGAFCLSDFWTLCPEVRSGSPGCRSPPALHFVFDQPINRNKMEDKL